MEAKGDNILAQNKVFVWVAAATGLILLIPLIAMRFTSEVSWDIADITVMGTLLVSTGSLFVLTARRVNKKYRVVFGVALAAALLYLWTELAVGIFTNWGS